jgi:hypothetical protein
VSYRQNCHIPKLSFPQIVISSSLSSIAFDLEDEIGNNGLAGCLFGGQIDKVNKSGR